MSETNLCKDLKNKFDEFYMPKNNIVDDLVTEDGTKCLSAKQGKILKTQLDVVEAEVKSIEAGSFDDLIAFI